MDGRQPIAIGHLSELTLSYSMYKNKTFIKTGLNNSKVNGISQIKQAVHGPYRSPGKKFHSINTFAQSYEIL